MKKALLFLLLPLLGFSQTAIEKKAIISKTNVAALRNIAEKSDFKFKDSKKKALALAKVKNWPLFTFKDSVYSELIDATTDLKPIYYSTYNKGAGITSRANRLYTGGSLGLNINGENMTAAVWDAGSGMPSHELFSNRMELMDNSPSTHYHSAHVAGTIIGSDAFQNGNARGMAYKGNVKSYDWNSDIAEVATAASNGLLLSNHSYGRSPYGVATSEWGKYDAAAQSYDEIMFNAPYYQFVCAAGNSRIYGVNTSKNGYDLLSGHATSKNGITVAAVNELLDYTGPGSVIMSAFSSWGGSDDGRIKPDISAKGVDTFSASDISTSSYDTLSGTSMASPSVVGTLLLYQQYYKQLNNSFLKAATLKGLMIHTADEAGSTPGPDYKFGWGLINAEKAADVIKKNATESFILENTLNQDETYTLAVNAIGTAPLVATLCWTDPKGNIPNSAIDDATPNLINNLDIKITQNGTTYFPWKLDGANVANAASQGDNNVDNVEKVDLNNPSGSYLITINHKGNLQNGLQNYALIISGITARDFWTVCAENSKSICDGTATVAYDFTLHTKANFSETVAYSTVNLPEGITATFNPATMNAGGNFTMTLTNLTSLLPGIYTFTVKSQTPTDHFENEISIAILSPTIATSILTQPLSNADSVELPAVFNWVADANAQSYDLQISSDVDFNTIIQQATVSQNNFTSSLLNNNTIYFWRVRAKNSCNTGEYAVPFRFSTVCGLPSNIVLDSSTITGATISWNDNFNPNSWEIEWVPQGTNPTGVGTMVNNTTFNFSGLDTNSCYNFYVRSHCGNGTSSWTAPFTFCTQPDYCAGDHFYDTGGPDGNYQNYENYVKTIYPDMAGNRVRAIFNAFDVENGWDYFAVYNGPDEEYPLIFSGTGTGIPTNLASTHPSGALTFRFVSDNIISRSGWDATIVCEPLPPCPDTPILGVGSLVSVAYTSAVINWEGNSSITSWEIEIVPHGTTPTGTGIITTSKPYTASNLNSNSQYDCYIRSICSNGNSDWSVPFNFETKANYCGGDHFYDTGGLNGDYPLYQYKVTTINPANAGDRIKATFNAFNLGAYASFVVYNSATTNGPILFQSNGSNVPDTLTATNMQGALTFEFYVNSNVTASGWDASIVCEPLPPCPNAPSYVYLNNATATTASLYWSENSNATSWRVEVVPHGTTPTGFGFPTGSNPYLKTGLTPNTWYDFYVRSQCSNGNSDWSVAYVFHTQANYCNGDHYYDEGGPDDNYPTSGLITQTILPTGTGNRVKAIFNNFQIGNNDTFTVYNSAYGWSSQILYTGTGSTPPPTTLEATNPQGAMTFVFSSGSNNTNAGWDASIVCETLPPCSNSPTNISLYNSSTTSGTFSWAENSNATSWEIEVVPHAAAPTGTGTVASTNPYTKNGLISNTWYDFYVRSRCGSANSTWTGPFVFNTKPNYCAGDHFYDSAGPNENFPSYENKITVLYPTNSGDRIKAIFNSFQIGSGTSFKVYNAADSYNESNLIYTNSGGSVSPGTLIATNPSGALTFTFYNYYQSTSAGWDASILCEPMPPCSNPPSYINVTATTTTSATLNWTENANAGSWEVEFIPHNATPTGTGTVTSSRPYLKSGLTSNTWYDFYIRSKCGTVNSTWIGPFVFNTKANYCAGDHFYDSAGPDSNYPGYENKTTTIYPTGSGNRIRAIFNSFQINDNASFEVYNADNPYNDQTLIYSSFTANNATPGTLLATNITGALTFVFYNYSPSTLAGWDASIVCEPLPPCSQSPSYIYLNDATTTTARFGWTENSNAASWEIEIVPLGSLPTGSGITVASNPYNKTGLTSNTWYNCYIRSKCGSVNSIWTGPFPFNTKANYCAGDHFYDSAGPNNNYPSNESKVTTIYPTNSGDRIKAIFNSFQINSNASFEVYNAANNYNAQNIIYSSYTANGALPGTLTATNIIGALTFVFYNYSQTTASGWDASIICEPLPPCSQAPSNIYLNDTTTTTARFSWADNANATSWEIEIVPQGILPSGAGSILTSNPYTKTGLISNTWYNFYVRSKCGSANSTWAGPFQFHTKADYCAGDHFYDAGGPATNYPINDYENITIYPIGTGNRVKAVFNTFQLNTYDTFTVYDGPNTSYPVLYSRNSSNPIAPSTIVATNMQGALTFYFDSYGQTNAGWDASIICEPFPACSFKPTGLTASAITSSSAEIHWTENSNATSWEYEVVAEGTAPTGVGTVTTNITNTITSLNSDSCYTIYVRSICTSGTTEWTIYTFCTTPNYCANNHFYDTGGPGGEYEDYENYTTVIYPETPGNAVQAIFNSFVLESCCDVMRIYNGPNASMPLLYSGGSVSPGTKTSTHPSGALTFVFTSDSSATRSGWDATINCNFLGTTNNNILDSIEYYPNPVDDLLHIKSKDVITKYQVYDINMRLIANENINATAFDIKLSAYSAGAYFVKLLDVENKTKEIKVLKK